MSEPVKLNIDGRDVEVEAGTFILEAARKIGIEIPTFCYDQRLKSVGACRMCLVEVEKSPKLVASCATPVSPGMVIKTESKRVVEARKGVLEFLLINHPLDCPTCDKGGECPLQNLTYKYGPPQSRFGENKIRFQDGTNLKFDDLKIGPEIWLNRNRCIICYKCVRIARDLAGSSDIGMFKRGAYARIDIPAGVQYANEFSGNTVEYCPVGALMSDSFRYIIRTWRLTRTPSICWLCPDGCNMTVEHNAGKIYRHQSRRNDSIDQGFLCDKGRYGFDITSNTDRIKLPLAIHNGSFKEISYEEALAMVVHRFGEEKGETSALLLDSSLTNEEAFSGAEYYEDKFKGSAIAIATENNIDPNQPALSFGLATTITDLENSDMIILAGCDLEVEHPILGLRIKKLANAGIPVYFISSRQMHLGRFPINNIQTNYGSEYLVVDNIISLLSGGIDTDFKNDLKNQIVTDLGKAKNVQIIGGAEILANPNYYSWLNSLSNLKTLVNAKFAVLPQETNLIGVQLAGQPNCSFGRLIEQIEAGKIKTLLIAGGDPINVYPDRQRITKAFKEIDYLIYWGAFLNATADMASLILPRALPTESSGSFINVERRLQFTTKPYPLNKTVTSLTRLITDIKIELGGRSYYSSAEVFAQMKKSVAQFTNLKHGESNGHVFPPESLKKTIQIDALQQIKAPADRPFILTFVRSVYYGVSGTTTRSHILQRLTTGQHIKINPTDAARLNLAEKDKIKVETARAAGEFEIRITSDINSGEITLSGYSEDNPPNKFMEGFNKPVYAKMSKV